MNNERPFENIIPVQNIKVGYFEKEEYLKIIDRQEKQIQSFAWKILALQSRIEILEKNKKTKGEWIRDGVGLFKCSLCSRRICTEISNDKPYIDFPFCHCGAEMKGGDNKC